MKKKTAQTSPAPTNANSLVRDMINVVADLKAVYVRENSALEAADTNAFMALQEEKLKTVQRYQSLAGEIMARKDDMKSVDAGLKQKLLEQERDLAERTRTNLDALARMQRCAERLGGLIMQSAKDALKKTRAVAYGDNGIIKADERKIVSTGMIETA